MRIHLTLSPSTGTVPYDYQVNLAGAFHEWLGEQASLHQDISLYSFSWLKGGQGSKGGLIFPKGAHWNISAADHDLIQQLVTGIQNSPDLAYGMTVQEVQLEQEPSFKPEGGFLVQSPILVKRQEANGHERYYTFDETAADELLTETLQHKLSKAGREDLSAEVAFDRSYRGAKTKVINYKGIQIKGNVCPVYMKGDPEALAFAWNVGVGNSTGIGFGCLK